MSRKTCLWDNTHKFNCKVGEEWKFLCKSCYAKHYVPVKDKYTMNEFKYNIKAIKAAEKARFDSNCETFHQNLQEERDLETYFCKK